MDHTPISSTPTRDVFYYLAASALFILILAGTWWYTERNTKPLYPVFNPAKQFVPVGTEPRDIDQSLAVFGFSKPLPFFDEKNVVQSLRVGANAPASTTASSISSVPKARVMHISGPSSRTPPPPNRPSTFLSYRIVGPDKGAIRNAFIAYFINMGWKMANTREGQPLLFSSDTHQIISITLLGVPAVQNTGKSIIVAALTVQ